MPLSCWNVIELVSRSIARFFRPRHLVYIFSFAADNPVLAVSRSRIWTVLLFSDFARVCFRALNRASIIVRSLGRTRYEGMDDFAKNNDDDCNE